MTTLAKWVWVFIITMLFVGTDIIYFVGINILVCLLIRWLKPEWYEKF